MTGPRALRIGLGSFFAGLMLSWLLACFPEPVAPNSPPSPPPSDSLHPKLVLVTDYPSADSALRVAEFYGSVLDMDSCRDPAKCNVALDVRSSPLLIRQAENVTIQNCGINGLHPIDARPVLRAADSVNVYFFTLRNCKVFGKVDFTRFFNSTFQDLWMVNGGIFAAGPAYYNQFINIYGSGVCIEATAPDGVYSGPNHNSVTGGRCQGTIRIGRYVQDWSIARVAFEGCGIEACLEIGGRAVWVVQNRFECASPLGIWLRYSDSYGWIDSQYWSSCTTRIKYDDGADPATWFISSQPAQQ